VWYGQHVRLTKQAESLITTERNSIFFYFRKYLSTQLFVGSTWSMSRSQITVFQDSSARRNGELAYKIYERFVDHWYGSFRVSRDYERIIDPLCLYRQLRQYSEVGRTNELPVHYGQREVPVTYCPFDCNYKTPGRQFHAQVVKTLDLSTSATIQHVVNRDNKKT